MTQLWPYESFDSLYLPPSTFRLSPPNSKCWIGRDLSITPPAQSSRESIACIIFVYLHCYRLFDGYLCTKWKSTPLPAPLRDSSSQTHVALISLMVCVRCVEYLLTLDRLMVSFVLLSLPREITCLSFERTGCATRNARDVSIRKFHT